MKNGKREIEADENLEQQLSIVELLSKKGYKVLDMVCYRIAFKSVFCVGNQMLSHLDKLKEQDIMLHK
jgi:hypothetical protein